MDIQTVDPYLSAYVYEKATNPSKKLFWRAYKENQVRTVNKIVELARGKREIVKTLDDWDIVEELLRFFASEWPAEFNEFRKSIPDIRSSRRDGGYSESGEIKYVGAMPPRFMKLIKAIFPFQQFDKKFVNKLVRKIPLFKVGGVNNLSKGSIII